MNIFQMETGEYYYSNHKKEKTDLLIERNISTDYAYNFCAKKNFGVKNKDVSKKNDSKPGHQPNDTWSRENRAMVQQHLT